MVKRVSKSADGHYHIKGHKYEKLLGSRAQVWHGTAYKTNGELTKKNLYMNKTGHIVSLKKHITAKRENRLLKHGFGTKKGKFGFVKLRRSMRNKTKRGGNKPLDFSEVKHNTDVTGSQKLDK